MIRLLEASGADVLAIPVIAVVPPSSWDSLDHVLGADYDWLVFTSPNGVDAFFDRMRTKGKQARAKIAAVGAATAEALRGRRTPVDAVPAKFAAKEVATMFSSDLAGVRIAIIRAEEGREELITELRERGAHVDLGIAYRTVPANHDVDELRKLIATDAIDVVTFTSGSTVDYFFRNLSAEERDRLASSALFASIGPNTTEALRRHGLKAGVEAENATIEHLHDAIVKEGGRPARKPSGILPDG